MLKQILKLTGIFDYWRIQCIQINLYKYNNHESMFNFCFLPEWSTGVVRGGLPAAYLLTLVMLPVPYKLTTITLTWMIRQGNSMQQYDILWQNS